ncbi:MAG: endonuclease/exonuclease/phosphatase family protein, partial [Bacteroidota bacterium]
MKRYLAILIFSFLFACKGSGGASSTAVLEQDELSKDKDFVVAFYNVENLFDTEDNPDKIDEDFTPGGKYEWDQKKYKRKLFQIAKAIESIGENGPDLLGLGEVENPKVIEDLLNQEQLKDRPYEFVHFESPDMRGIDVAFVYDSKVFKVEEKEAYEVYFDQEPDYTSRKILCVSGKLKNQSLHILVNHWPSRYGGQAESEDRRLTVANKAKEVMDALYAKDEDAHIIIMGDMNDDPFNKSLVESLGAVGDEAALEENGFFNPMTKLHDVDSY